MGDFSIPTFDVSLSQFPFLSAFLSPFPVAFWGLGLVFLIFSKVPRLKSFELPAILCGGVGSVVAWLLLKNGQITLATALPGFAGVFLLPVDSERSQTAFIFFTAGWAFVTLLMGIEKIILNPKARRAPTWVGLLGFMPLLLASVFMGLGGNEAYKFALKEAIPPDSLETVPSNLENTAETTANQPNAVTAPQNTDSAATSPLLVVPADVPNAKKAESTPNVNPASLR